MVARLPDAPAHLEPVGIRWSVRSGDAHTIAAHIQAELRACPDHDGPMLLGCVAEIALATVQHHDATQCVAVVCYGPTPAAVRIFDTSTRLWSRLTVLDGGPLTSAADPRVLALADRTALEAFTR